MKRLLAITMVLAVGSGWTGCASKRPQPCRPACAPMPMPACGGGEVYGTYGTPGTIINAPTLSTPQAGTLQTIPMTPGPETYTTPAPQ